jgi:CRP/FNR family transcriptional regulator, cyclic AMP receptor protein
MEWVEAIGNLAARALPTHLGGKSHLDWVEAIGYLAALITLATFYMKTMIPLRVAGIASNFVWIAYGALAGVYPPLVLHVLLLPLNVIRLQQMITLVNRVRAVTQEDPSLVWLKPFMGERRARAGEVLFKKDDPAGEMFFTITGRFLLRETGIELGGGALVGELGLLSPGQKRTQTLECVADGRLLVISYDRLKQLFIQNPQFGFFFLRLTTARLFANLSYLEAEVARLQGQPARS